MLESLIESAFQTGTLSVESEGLMRQVLAARGFNQKELDALKQLYAAIEVGQIRREAHRKTHMPPIQLPPIHQFSLL